MKRVLLNKTFASQLKPHAGRFNFSSSSSSSIVPHNACKKLLKIYLSSNDNYYIIQRKTSHRVGLIESEQPHTPPSPKTLMLSCNLSSTSTTVQSKIKKNKTQSTGSKLNKIFIPKMQQIKFRRDTNNSWLLNTMLTRQHRERYRNHKN